MRTALLYKDKNWLGIHFLWCSFVLHVEILIQLEYFPFVGLLHYIALPHVLLIGTVRFVVPAFIERFCCNIIVDLVPVDMVVLQCCCWRRGGKGCVWGMIELYIVEILPHLFLTYQLIIKTDSFGGGNGKHPFSALHLFSCYWDFGAELQSKILSQFKIDHNKKYVHMENILQ